MNKINMDKKILKKIRNIQFKIGKISKDKENPFFKSKYFDINQLLETLTPLLEEQGLTVIQPLDYSEQNDRPLLRTIISDDEGTVDYATPLPQNPDPQKMGSIITYYRRYTLQSLFCLQAEEDDGEKAKIKTKKKKTADDLNL